MSFSKKDWLILGLCAALVVALGFYGWRTLQLRITREDAATALDSTVDFALSGLDSAVYMSNNRVNWSDPAFRLGFYKNLLQAQEGAAAASYLAHLTSGDASAVAGRLGDLAAQLDSIYLPAAQRLAAGQVKDEDLALLNGFCDILRKSGWPLKTQLRDQGWIKLRECLDTLFNTLGPASQQPLVLNVPDYPSDQSPDNGGKAGGGDQANSGGQQSTGITVKIGPSGA